MLTNKQLETICKGLPSNFQKAGLDPLMEVAKKAARDAEENYNKLPEPKTRSLFSYTAFWIKSAIIFNEDNSNIGKLIREQEGKNEQCKSAWRKHTEAHAKYYETILPGGDNNVLPKDRTPNTEDIWRKIDERIVFDTEEEILKDHLPLFSELKPKYISLVNALNNLAQARGYKSQLESRIDEKVLKSFTDNKEAVVKHCQEQISEMKVPSWFYSQFNRQKNLNFIKLLPNLPDIGLPDEILDIASGEYPILNKFRGRIFFDLDCKDSKAYYEKKTDTFKIIINKDKDRWEQTVELFNSIANVISDLTSFEANWNSESINDSVEHDPYWIEFKLLKKFLPKVYQARVLSILSDIADIIFLLEVYKNPDQDLPKLYANAVNHCFPDAKQTENYTYLIKDHLSFHPFSTLPQAIAQVKVLGESLDR